MTKPVKKLLFWAPRIICILFAAFLSLFALDVFEEGQGILKTIIALLIHLVPVYVVVIVLILSWRWEWIGAILFVGLGVFYIAWAWGRFTLVAYFGISGPLFLVGILFLLNWIFRKELKFRNEAV